MALQELKQTREKWKFPKDFTIFISVNMDFNPILGLEKDFRD